MNILLSFNLDKYKGDFNLPEFHVYPDFDQLVFENDTIEYFCYTTWMESSRISWLLNGQKILPNKNVKITISVDYRAGSLSSKLVIKRCVQDLKLIDVLFSLNCHFT